MTATAAAFGLDPIYHPSGTIRPRALKGGIASGLSSDIFRGQAVKLSTDGVLVPIASTSDALAGVFAGCQYTPPGGARPQYLPYWPANATYIAGTMTAYFFDDHQIIYRIQANGSVAQPAIGDEANLVNYTSGNTAFGNSTMSMSASLVGAGNQGQLRVVDLFLGVDNAWGDAYTIVTCQIARHQQVYPQVAI